MDGDAGCGALLSVLEQDVAPLCDSPEGSGKVNERAHILRTTPLSESVDVVRAKESIRQAGVLPHDASASRTGATDERSAPATLHEAARALMDI